jgi:hypothetical protein
MTPLTLARAECANMRHSGKCMGISVESLIDDGKPPVATPRDICLLAQRKRCDYFERCILPLADHPSPDDNPKLQAGRADAREIYLGQHVICTGGIKGRCPDCGGPRPRRHRYCESCSTKHRREAGKRRIRDLRQKNGEPVTL